MTHAHTHTHTHTNLWIYSRMLTLQLFICPILTHTNSNFHAIASGMLLATFFHPNRHVGRHMLRCSWRFIIFYFGICERMLLFGKQQRLAGTYGKCWNTWDLLMRIQRTCVKWGGKRGQWTATMQDRIIAPTAPKVLVTNPNHIRWSYSQTLAFKMFISVPWIWICLLRKYLGT
jgi:hypothetical protein